MAAEPGDSVTTIEAILTAIGITSGGGGFSLFRMWGTQKKHEESLKELTRNQIVHDKKIEIMQEQNAKTEVTLSGLKDSLDKTESGVHKIVRHLTGSDLV